MRYFIALFLCCLLASPRAHACLSPASYETFFFKTIPDPPPDADVIAKVSFPDVNGKTDKVTANVIQVLKTSNTKIRQGTKIPMQYGIAMKGGIGFSDCGPWLANGDEGMIIAKIRADSKGRLVLHPYSHRPKPPGDGMIFPPRD